MTDKDINIDLFDEYLQNRLPDAERAKFDEKLLIDAAFSEEFLRYKTIAYGIKDYSKADLKDYIKTNGKVAVTKGINFQPKQLRYAIAASLILFAGIYVVINYYVKPNVEKNLVTNASEQKVSAQPDSSVTIMPETVDMAASENPTKQLRENKSAEEIAPNSEANGTARKYEVDDLSNELPVPASPEYKVLSDKKLSDTIMLAYYVVVEDLDNKVKFSEKESTTLKKSLPSTDNNNYSKSKNEIVIVTKGSDTADKDKKISKPLEVKKADNYTVEYWQSPVNFRGYKMVGYTLQLFGLGATSTAVKLYKVDFQLYLRMNGTVYLLKSCPDGCKFDVMADPEISAVILKQK